jgi:hypothetical protein
MTSSVKDNPSPWKEMNYLFGCERNAILRTYQKLLHCLIVKGNAFSISFTFSPLHRILQFVYYLVFCFILTTCFLIHHTVVCTHDGYKIKVRSDF